MIGGLEVLALIARRVEGKEEAMKDKKKLSFDMAAELDGGNAASLHLFGLWTLRLLFYIKIGT